MSPLFRKLTYYYPLTLPGTALFVVACALFLHGYRAENDYALLLAIAAVLAIVVAALLTRVQAARFSQEPVEWVTSTPLYSGQRGNKQSVRTTGIVPWLFFRLHFSAGGWLQVGREARLYLGRSVATGEGDMELPVSSPLSGEWRAVGRLSVRDVFGISRARFGGNFPRTLLIQPGPFPERPIHSINAFGGAEQTSTRKSTDLERYYMREYIPGDRVRDINWKATSRLSQLVTKVSPHTEEKTYVIPVEFRHFRRGDKDTFRALAHLERLKSWILAFVRKLREEHPNYHFRVKTLYGETLIQEDADIDQLSRELATTRFEEAVQDFGFDPSYSEVYIFSTPYDEGLAHALARYGDAKIHLFRTRHAPRKRATPVRLAWEKERGDRGRGAAGGAAAGFGSDSAGGREGRFAGRDTRAAAAGRGGAAPGGGARVAPAEAARGSGATAAEGAHGASATAAAEGGGGAPASAESPAGRASSSAGGSTANGKRDARGELRLLHPLESAPLPWFWVFRRDGRPGGTGGAPRSSKGGALYEHDVDPRLV